MSRTQLALAAILVVQVLLLLVVYAPWSSGGATVAVHSLLPALESFTPSRLEITEGDSSIVLAHDGDEWRLEQADGFPAVATKVDGLLEDLRGLEVRRPVVTSSRYHDALKVGEDENERRLRIWEAGEGDPRAVLFLGSSPNYGVNHVRIGGEDAVYEVRGLSPWDLRAEAGAWIDEQLTSVEADQVTGLTLANEHGAIELTRRDGVWVLAANEAAVLDATKVDSLVSSLGNLRFSEPAGKAVSGAYGFDDPAARLELIYDTDGTLNALELVLGTRADEESGTRYARRTDSEYAVVLSKWDAERLTDKKLDELYPDPPNGDEAQEEN